MGSEQDASYYDERLSREKYQQHFALSPYIRLWQLAYLSAVQPMRDPSVLDLGCGSGQFAAMLNALGVRRYCGVDFSTVAVESGRRVCPDYDFRQKDLRTLEASDFDGFNIVTCLETLEHIHRDRAVLETPPIGMRVALSVPRYDSESHVRHFPNREDVLERYAPYVGASKLYGPIGGRWWLLVGKRRRLAPQSGK